MNFKKILLSIALIIFIISLIFLVIYIGNTHKSNSSDKMSIVVSNFASYDFIRQIINGTDDIDLIMLVKPGTDAHSFDPTAKDIVMIENSDVFVYIGGEVEPWAEKIITSSNIDKNNIFCIADYVDKEKEEDYGFEKHEHEEDSFNYHIWTSPDNAIDMVISLKERIIKLNEAKANIYEENAESYIGKIKEVDNLFKEVIKNKKRDLLVFGDKMPMQYFINYYGLNVEAAFNGCSSETEPSTKTISHLSSLVNESGIPVILYTELNDGKVASVIAKEAANNAEILKIQTLHNISLEDFNNKETWISLMKRNIGVLEKALY